MSRLYDANGKWHYACYAQVITVALQRARSHTRVYTHVHTYTVLCELCGLTAVIDFRWMTSFESF